MSQSEVDYSKPLTSVALRGAVVTGIAQAIKIAIQFVTTIVLARLLVPADFGLIACVAPVIALVGMAQEIGLQQAVVQREEVSDDLLNRIYWLKLVLGVASSALVMALSPVVTWFYGDDRLTTITLVASLPLLIGNASTLQTALMNRRLQFGALAVLELAALIAGTGAAIVGAALGMGYWALLISPLTSAVVMLGGATLASGWRPGAPRLGLERQILSFGANLTGFSLMNYLVRNLDNVLIGRYAGSVALGYYDRAYKLLLFPLQNINGPLARVMLPVLSRIQTDPGRLRRVYLRTTSLLTLLTVPGIAAVTIVAEEVVGLLFGSRWLPAAPILAWLGLSGLMQPLANTTGWIFIAQGRAREMFRWGIYSSVVYVASFVVGLRWGAVGVAAALAIASYALGYPVLFWLMGRLGPVRTRDFLIIQMPLLAAAAATWGLVTQGLVGLLHLRGTALVLVTVAVSYLVAIGVSALHPAGKSALREIVGLLSGRQRLSDVPDPGAGGPEP